MVFRRNRPALIPRRVWLADAAREEMQALAERFDRLETGGMLCGYLSAEDQEPVAVVTEVIGPGPDALHGRYRFVPDGPWQRTQLAGVFRGSNGVTTYLGDWHTHPCGRGTPSERDRKTAEAIAKKRAARAPHPLMMIMYGETDALQVSALAYSRRRLKALDCQGFADTPPSHAKIRSKDVFRQEE